MNKDELVTLHSQLNVLETIVCLNGLRGHDMKSVLQSIWEVQEVVEKLANSLSTPTPSTGADGSL